LQSKCGIVVPWNGHLQSEMFPSLHFLVANSSMLPIGCFAIAFYCIDVQIHSGIFSAWLHMAAMLWFTPFSGTSIIDRSVACFSSHQS